MNSPVPHTPSPAARWSRTALIVFVFLAILSVKVATIARYGTDVPYWDQWGKEGDMFYRPWFEHHEFWSNLLVPHNEHRIAPTLITNFVLLQLGDNQWDARVECVFNAALHAALMAGIAAWALRRFRTRTAVALALLLVLLAAPPIAWENVLGGFQSQFYYLAIFSILALGGLLGAPAGSWRWWGGLAATAAAMVSMGSGMLVAFPIAVVAARRILQRRQTSRQLVTLAVALVIGAVGWIFRPHAPWHESLHARSLLEFLEYALQCIAWPLYDRPWLAPLLWAPWVVLTARWLWQSVPLRRSTMGHDSDDRLADYIVAGGIWVLVQVAAVTYSRAGGGGLPAPRYGDLMALGLAFNAFALAVLARKTLPQSPSAEKSVSQVNATNRAGRIGIRAGVVVWSAGLIVAMAFSTVHAIDVPLPKKKREVTAYERNTHAFVLTDNFAILQAGQKADELPFPLIDWFARMLRNPVIRNILPVSIASPIAIPGLDTHNAPSVGLPVLDARATRTTTEGTEWTSPPLQAARGWWKIETAGAVGEPGATLELESASDHRVLAHIVPSKPAGMSWRAAYVPAPREPAVIHVRVVPPARFVAFSEPIRMSSLSFWTWRFCEHAGWLVAFAFAGLILAVTASVRTERDAA